MDIKLMPVGRPEEAFTFPSLPAEIRGTVDTKYRTYTVISKGDIQVPRGIETNEYQCDGQLYGVPNKNDYIVKRI